ncbi:ATP-binding protein [Sphaerisporangium fuscum]|uniref:ATP-binding protein n=1 Tax=Sphaerisporangium fuscum TaxID=2835868 RepID=UPI001BDCB8F2|nr:ATP-binding protein [Sphaerisporangium fuscum]
MSPLTLVHDVAAERRLPCEIDSAADRRVITPAQWRIAGNGLGEDIFDLVEEAGVRMVSWWLPDSGCAAAAARRLTRACLEAWEMDDHAEVAELLVSELVTNAIRHAHGAIRHLTLAVFEGALRAEVTDTDSTLPEMREAADDDEGGRGLKLLDLLSCCWGAIRTPEGKAMWFELPASPAFDHC